MRKNSLFTQKYNCDSKSPGNIPLRLLVMEKTSMKTSLFAHIRRVRKVIFVKVSCSRFPLISNQLAASLITELFSFFSLPQAFRLHTIGLGSFLERG